MIYSIGFAAIKYTYGYTSVAFVGSKRPITWQYVLVFLSAYQSYPPLIGCGASGRKAQFSHSTSAWRLLGDSKCEPSLWTPLRADSVIG